ncbi:MAG: hypothetical protein JWM85_1455 [Acidimicrobiaceae bacterium]|nr:hypothetical protein [Acidimicrobiaceae bacterium]
MDGDRVQAELDRFESLWHRGFIAESVCLTQQNAIIEAAKSGELEEGDLLGGELVALADAVDHGLILRSEFDDRKVDYLWEDHSWEPRARTAFRVEAVTEPRTFTVVKSLGIGVLAAALNSGMEPAAPVVSIRIRDIASRKVVYRIRLAVPVVIDETVDRIKAELASLSVDEFKRHYRL